MKHTQSQAGYEFNIKNYFHEIYSILGRVIYLLPKIIFNKTYLVLGQVYIYYQKLFFMKLPRP